MLANIFYAVIVSRRKYLFRRDAILLRPASHEMVRCSTIFVGTQFIASGMSCDGEMLHHFRRDAIYCVRHVMRW